MPIVRAKAVVTGTVKKHGVQVTIMDTAMDVGDGGMVTVNSALTSQNKKQKQNGYSVLNC